MTKQVIEVQVAELGEKCWQNSPRNLIPPKC